MAVSDSSGFSSLFCNIREKKPWFVTRLSSVLNTVSSEGISIVNSSAPKPAEFVRQPLYDSRSQSVIVISPPPPPPVVVVSSSPQPSGQKREEETSSRDTKKTEDNVIGVAFNFIIGTIVSLIAIAAIGACSEKVKRSKDFCQNAQTAYNEALCSIEDLNESKEPVKNFVEDLGRIVDVAESRYWNVKAVMAIALAALASGIGLCIGALNRSAMVVNVSGVGLFIVALSTAGLAARYLAGSGCFDGKRRDRELFERLATYRETIQNLPHYVPPQQSAPPLAFTHFFPSPIPQVGSPLQ